MQIWGIYSDTLDFFFNKDTALDSVNSAVAY